MEKSLPQLQIYRSVSQLIVSSPDFLCLFGFAPFVQSYCVLRPHVSVKYSTSSRCSCKGRVVGTHVPINVEMSHAATKAALDVLGDVRNPASSNGAPFHGRLGNFDGVCDGLVTVRNVLWAAPTRASVSAWGVLRNVILSSACAPVVVSLVVVEDFFVVFWHVFHLLIFYLCSLVFGVLLDSQSTCSLNGQNSVKFFRIHVSWRILFSRLCILDPCNNGRCSGSSGQSVRLSSEFSTSSSAPLLSEFSICSMFGATGGIRTHEVKHHRISNPAQ